MSRRLRVSTRWACSNLPHSNLDLTSPADSHQRRYASKAQEAGTAPKTYEAQMTAAAWHPQRWPLHPDLKIRTPLKIHQPPPQASFADLSRAPSRWSHKKVTAPWEITEADRQWWLMHAQLMQLTEDSPPRRTVDGITGKEVRYLRALGVTTIRDLARVTYEEGRALVDKCGCHSIFVSIEHAKVLVKFIDKSFQEKSLRDYDFLRTDLPSVVLPTDVVIPTVTMQGIPHMQAPPRRILKEERDAEKAATVDKPVKSKKGKQDKGQPHPLQDPAQAEQAAMEYFAPKKKANEKPKRVFSMNRLPVVTAWSLKNKKKFDSVRRKAMLVKQAEKSNTALFGKEAAAAPAKK